MLFVAHSSRRIKNVLVLSPLRLNFCSRESTLPRLWNQLPDYLSTTHWSLHFWLTRSFDWHFLHRFHRLTTLIIHHPFLWIPREIRGDGDVAGIRRDGNGRCVDPAGMEFLLREPGDDALEIMHTGTLQNILVQELEYCVNCQAKCFMRLLIICSW